jgi:hypothetical protein
MIRRPRQRRTWLLLGLSAVGLGATVLAPWLVWRAGGIHWPPPDAAPSPGAWVVRGDRWPAEGGPCLWYERVNQGIGCYRLPGFDLVTSLPEEMPSDHAYYMDPFAGDWQGETVAFFGDVGGWLIEPKQSWKPVGLIRGAEIGVFAADGRRFAFWGAGRLWVCQVPDDLSLRSTRTELTPTASITTPQPKQLLWPPGGDRVIAVGSKDGKIAGCRAYDFGRPRPGLVWERKTATAVAASVDGRVLVVSPWAKDPSRSSVELIGPRDTGNESQVLALRPQGSIDCAAVAGDVVLVVVSIRPSGVDEGVEVIGFSSREGARRFTLTVPTYVGFYPQELVRGYAVAEVASSGVRQHHPEVVVMDCTAVAIGVRWPSIVAEGPCGFFSRR